MTRTGASIVLSVAVVVSVLWGLAMAATFSSNWPDTVRVIAQERAAGKRGCATRYYDAEARERCEGLFDVEYIGQINTAIATRVLIAAGPLAGVGIWMWWRRRSDNSEDRRLHR